jgi:amidase
MCSLAQGADTAGSIRYPAACCGVVGLRPTKGRVPGWAGPDARDPSLATQEYVVQGPLARRVDDLRLGLAAMQDPDPRDPSTVPLPRVGEAGPVPASRPIKVAMVIDPGGPGLAGRTGTEAAEATRAAGEWLRQAGYEVDEVPLPELGEAASLWWKLALAELALGLRAEVQRAGSEHSKAFFELMFTVHESAFGPVDLAQFLAGQARSGALRRRVSEFMVDYPLLLTPMAGEPPFPLGADIESVDRVAEMMAFAWPSMSVPVLRLPALGLAATLGDGVPLGVQLVGRPFTEDLVLQVGEVIEARSGIVTPLEPRPAAQG